MEMLLSHLRTFALDTLQTATHVYAQLCSEHAVCAVRTITMHWIRWQSRHVHIRALNSYRLCEVYAQYLTPDYTKPVIQCL